jgi:hypothetical protein
MCIAAERVRAYLDSPTAARLFEENPIQKRPIRFFQVSTEARASREFFSVGGRGTEECRQSFEW